jgi:FAD:protein FMN transferase
VTERRRAFPCFGGIVSVQASGTGRGGLSAPASLVVAEAMLTRLHERLTPFDPGSELSRLNANADEEVPAGAILRRLAAAVRPAGLLSGGLVDATAPGSDPGIRDGWRHVRVDAARGTITRPPGLRIDPCGLAKGLAADLVARRLATHPSFLVDCLGDLRTGGTLGLPREVRVADPFGSAGPVATLTVTGGAAATSGTTRRAGHLIDPRTREPAATGVLQATALAPTGLEAEARAKAALLAGPVAGPRHLPHGGVLVLTDGTVLELPAAQARAALHASDGERRAA